MDRDVLTVHRPVIEVGAGSQDVISEGSRRKEGNRGVAGAGLQSE